VGARRHRENQIDGVPAALSPAHTIGPPFFGQVTHFSCAFDTLAVFPFTDELAVAGDIGKVFLQAAKASGTPSYLDHHFRPPAGDPSDLGARQAHASA